MVLRQQFGLYRLLAILLVSMLVIASCGGGDDSGDSGSADSEPTATEAAAEPTEAEEEAEPTATEAEAASGEGEATEASGGEATEAPEGEATEASGGGSEGASGDYAEKPSFDLSGEEITITTAQPEAMGMIVFKVIDYLEQWGASVDRVELTSTTGIQALLANRTDIAAGGTDELILGAAEGAEVEAIVSTKSKMDYVMVASNDIQSISDLEGASIGMSGPAGFDALLSRVAIREEGMQVSDVNFVQIGGSGDRAAALLSGRVDAATIFISDWFELRRQSEDHHALLFMSDLVPDFTKSLLIANDTYWSDNPQIATAVACGILEANQWFNADKQAFIDYVLENVPGSTEEATSELYDLLVEINMFPTAPEEILSVEGMQGLVELMVENEDISEPIDASQYVDTSYLEEAHAMGCGVQQ